MRRLSLPFAAGVLLLSASTTLAGTPAGPKPGWEAVAGTFRTQAAANVRIALLTSKGFTGYTIEVENRPDGSKAKLYEVEREFTTQKLAVAEVARLHRAHLAASVELSTGTK